MSYPDSKPTTVAPLPTGKSSAAKVEDLTDVDFKGHAPTYGDALVYSPLDQHWHAAPAPAHIAQYSNATNYAAGIVVYHNGGLFKSNVYTIGNPPDFRYGDASFFKRANANGSGQFQGPFQFEAVNIVADPTVAPTTVPTVNTPHYTLQYKDDATWAVWVWDLQVPPGYRPGVDPQPTYQWHNKSAAYNPAKTKTWRTWSAPTSAYADFTLWIYDNPRGTTQPHFRKQDWDLLEIRKDMFALHDVLALNPQTGDELKYGADQNWHSESPVAVAAPATPTSTGVKGQVAFDSYHVYFCIDTNEWIRVLRDNTGGW